MNHNPQTPKNEYSLLVIEDSPDDIELFQYILRQYPQPIYFNHCWTVLQAQTFLAQLGPDHLPNLILFDLNLPGLCGQEILTYARRNDAFKAIPMVAFSTSDNVKDIQWCYNNGANSYIIKPSGYDKMKDTVIDLLDYWFNTVTVPTFCLK